MFPSSDPLQPRDGVLLADLAALTLHPQTAVVCPTGQVCAPTRTLPSTK